MIKLWLIRHGKTEGNKLSRYIGTTDEPLCQEGTEFLHKMDYPKVQAVYVSPLKRCVQTAEILFPGEPVHIIEELAECDFGEFENKNYKELEGNPHYQEWIDSNGTLPFPGGESRMYPQPCGRGGTCHPWRYDHEYHGRVCRYTETIL